MKTSRRRLDVDVEEPDRVIDATENGPLSKADRQKLKPLCTRWWNGWRKSETRRKPTPCWNKKLIHCGN